MASRDRQAVTANRQPKPNFDLAWHSSLHANSSALDKNGRHPLTCTRRQRLTSWPQGKAYTAEQREQVRGLLEQGKDEETIEKTTGVSDRTIRRWKLELERTGRIGKPPESRTGRHRVLSAEIEAVSVTEAAPATDHDLGEANARSGTV